MLNILLVHWKFPNLLDSVRQGLWGMGHRLYVTHHGRMDLKAQHFDLAIFYHPVREDEIPQEVRRMGDLSVLWTMDSPYEIDWTERIAKGGTVDIIWDSDRNSADYLRETLGQPAIHVPHCVYVERHPNPNDERIESDVCFLGHGFGRRVQLIEKVSSRLANYDVLLAGHTWEKRVPWARTFRSLKGHDAIAALTGAKVCLNIHRLRDDVPLANRSGIQPSSPNDRFFALAGLGCTQLVDRSRLPEILEYFDETEIAVFRDSQEFMEKLEFLLSHETERLAMGQRAKARALRDHTFPIRFNQALAETREALGK